MNLTKKAIVALALRVACKKTDKTTAPMKVMQNNDVAEDLRSAETEA